MQIKDALLLQAKYNKIANQKMFELLLTQDQAILNKDCGLYFQSIIGTLIHSLQAQIGIFLKQYSPYASSKPDGLDALLGCLDEELNLKKEHHTIQKLANLYAQTDEAILHIIQHTSDFSKEETLSFPTISFTKSRLQLMLAILNHSIHHRGEISGILDTLHIENDFNGMLRI